MGITFRHVLYAKSQGWNHIPILSFRHFPDSYRSSNLIYGTVSLNRDCLHKRGIALSDPASSNGLFLQLAIATFGELQPSKRSLIYNLLLCLNRSTSHSSSSSRIRFSFVFGACGCIAPRSLRRTGAASRGNFFIRKSSMMHRALYVTAFRS
jgi:hypothetical protein